MAAAETLMASERPGRRAYRVDATARDGHRDRSGLEVLDVATCLVLLTAAPIARVAYIAGVAARVVPLNIAIEDGTVLFRVGTGGLLAAVTDRQVLTVEADDVDVDGRCGWSVVVHGPAQELPQLPGRTLPRAGSWLRSDAARLVRLIPLEISGRRLSPTRTAVGTWDGHDAASASQGPESVAVKGPEPGDAPPGGTSGEARAR